MESVDGRKEPARNQRRHSDPNEKDFDRLVDEVVGRAWWSLTGEDAVRAGEPGFQAMWHAVRDALAGYLSRCETSTLLAMRESVRRSARTG